VTPDLQNMRHTGPRTSLVDRPLRADDGSIVAPAKDLFVASQEIIPKCDHIIPNPIVYSNYHRFGNVEFSSWVERGNVTRLVSQESVILGRYAAGACMDTGASYLLLTQKCLVKEQIAPWIADFPTKSRDMWSKASSAIPVNRPCLLASRYGETTWGHWLCELLPKVVVAEATYPKLFTFVVPRVILSRRHGDDAGSPDFFSRRSYSTSVIESLAAYGIEMSRVLQVEEGQHYRFDNLFDVAGIYGDGIHPGILELMHTAYLGKANIVIPKKIALLRRANERRSAFNRLEVSATLEQEGYKNFDLNQLSFVEQVALCSGATHIAADLGSNLAGIIFAPKSLKVITISPAGWYDGYFTNIIQRLDAFQADIRCAPTYLGLEKDATIDNSSYVVPIDDLRDGLSTIDEVIPGGKGVTASFIAGNLWPRRVGPPILEVIFGSKGTASQYTTFGWSSPEEDHTWSVGKTCELYIPGFAPPTMDDLWLEIEGIGFTAPPILPLKYLLIDINGKFFTRTIIQQSNHFLRFLGKAFWNKSNSDGIRFTFTHDSSPSPKSIGVSNDARELGFGFTRLRLRLSAR